VDFHTELQPGDSFRVLFESRRATASFSSYGAILDPRSTRGRRLHGDPLD